MSNGRKKNGIGIKTGLTQRYSWRMTSGGSVVCFKDSAGGQTITSLWETGEASLWHDEVLKKATKEINAILGKVDKANKDKKRVLSLIEYQNRHLLVWATYEDVVNSADDEPTVRKALKLKK